VLGYKVSAVFIYLFFQLFSFFYGRLSSVCGCIGFWEVLFLGVRLGFLLYGFCYRLSTDVELRGELSVGGWKFCPSFAFVSGN